MRITIQYGNKSEEVFMEALGSSGSGSDGVGIRSVEQTTTSTDDGGINIITVTKTDNTSSTFSVKNGSKGDKGDPGDGVYSEQETVIGKGIDGKPIYRRVFHFTFANFIRIPNTSQSYLKLDSIVRIQGMIKDKNGSQTYNLPFYYNEKEYVHVVYSNGGVTLSTSSNDNVLIGGTGTILIEYTKTTDVV